MPRLYGRQDARRYDCVDKFGPPSTRQRLDCVRLASAFVRVPKAGASSMHSKPFMPERNSGQSRSACLDWCGQLWSSHVETAKSSALGCDAYFMKAIVLAAGYGPRLRPLTDSLHKSMVPVSGVRIIDRIVDSLLLAGIREIVVVLGYKAEELRDHLTESHAGKAEFVFIENSRLRSTNNIYSLALALDKVDDDFVLIECDVFFDLETIRDLVNYPWPNVAVVAKYKTSMDGTVVSVDARQIVTGVHPTEAQGPAFDFSDKFKTLNIYKSSATVLREKLRKTVQFYTQAHSDNLLLRSCFRCDHLFAKRRDKNLRFDRPCVDGD